jgi:hypothetical protein
MTAVNLTDVSGTLHKASCIINYVSENSLNSDEVGIGETLKAAEELVLHAIQQLQEAQS